MIFPHGMGQILEDPATFNAGCPGIGLKQPSTSSMRMFMLAADTWPIEAIPGEDPNGAFDIHCLMQAVKRNMVP